MMLNTIIYFAGSAKLVVDRWLQTEKFPRLMSQLNDRNLIPRWVKYQREEYSDAKIFIDSGAYSAYTKGATIDVDAYIDYINANGDAFTVVAQVDFIPGKSNLETDPDIYTKAPGISWENYLYMRARLKPEIVDKLIPVFHQGEDFKWLRNMLDWRDPESGESLKYIGISPHTEVTSANRLDFLKKVYRIIKDSTNPHVKTHLFGMTALHLLKYVPATSVDSTTWLQSAIYGQILLHRGGKLSPITVSEKTLHAENHFIYLSPNLQDEVLNQIRSFGFEKTAQDLEAMRHDAHPSIRKMRAEAIKDDDDSGDSVINSISERQKFNAVSMQKFLEKEKFIGFPKSARRIGG